MRLTVDSLESLQFTTQAACVGSDALLTGDQQFVQPGGVGVTRRPFILPGGLAAARRQSAHPPLQAPQALSHRALHGEIPGPRDKGSDRGEQREIYSGQRGKSTGNEQGQRLAGQDKQEKHQRFAQRRQHQVLGAKPDEGRELAGGVCALGMVKPPDSGR